MSPESAKERDAAGYMQRLRDMSDDEKRKLAEAMVPADRPSDREPAKPKVPKPNEKCSCGSGKKYKKCCGSKAGETRVIVCDPTTGDVLRNVDDRVALFVEFAAAASAAMGTGWHKRPNTELVTLTEVKWRQMASEIPCADVRLAELESSSPPIQMDSSESEEPSPGTTERTSSDSSE
jgi:hypothetical protein